MLPSYVSGQLPDNTSPVVQELGRYTDTSVDLLWVPLTTYQDKTKIVMSSSKLPSIMVVLGKSPEFIHAAQRGMFWELGPYLKDYPNLREANQTVLRNISVDGRIYSLYRTRELGRYGVTIRKDWLDRVGLPLPKTIEELYEVLKAFTLHDPDGDGKQNTYGLAISYPATFDVLQTWFGAPNQWGKDEDGGLVPVHLTAEYRESLRFLKKLYEEGLIDPHFAVKDPKFVRDPLVHGEAGMLVDVADQAQRIASDIEKAYGLTDVIDVFSGVEGPQGLRLPSNSGYDGMLAVSTSAVKTEQELRRVLDFLDKLNDKEMQVLLTSGIQGRHYQKTPEMKDVDYNYEKDDLNKLLMYIPEVRTLPKAESPIRTKVQEVMKANESILVDNPAEAFISQTYMKNGPALDLIISDARIQFIIGQIDEAGWEQAMVQWRQNGGDAYMEEINRQYREAGSK
ncbi:Lipoprotein LipO precursor [compost metagenome]